MLNIKLTIGGCDIEASYSVGNLGIICDRSIQMKDQVNSVIKSYIFQLRNTGEIWQYLSEEAATNLIHTFKRYKQSRTLLSTFLPNLGNMMISLLFCKISIGSQWKSKYISKCWYSLINAWMMLFQNICPNFFMYMNLASPCNLPHSTIWEFLRPASRLTVTYPSAMQHPPIGMSYQMMLRGSPT